MANILFVTGDYYPYFSPNGSVIKNIIDELKKEHSVVVLSTKNRIGLETKISYDNYEIHRVNNYYSMLYNYSSLRYKNSESVISKQFFNKLLQSKRLLYFLYKAISKNSLNKNLINLQIKQMSKIYTEFKFDVIIPISMPIENIVSAIRYTELNNQSIHVIPYQIDHFSDSPTLHGNKLLKKIKFKSNLKMEEEILQQSSYYFIFPQIDNHMKKYHSSMVEKDKIIVTEHPLIVDKSKTHSISKYRFNKNKINLVFSGMLNVKVRNPNYLLNIMNLLSEENKLCLNFFHVGDCDAIINSYKNKLGENLQNHGQVSLKESFEAMNEANILISLGVIDGNQVSGKIFDYFSVGKPIIHLYYFDEDPNLKYLSKYPLSLCIKIDPKMNKENARKINKFCIENYNKKIDYPSVEKIFEDATPKYVSDKFNEKIKQVINC